MFAPEVVAFSLEEEEDAALAEVVVVLEDVVVAVDVVGFDPAGAFGFETEAVLEWLLLLLLFGGVVLELIVVVLFGSRVLCWNYRTVGWCYPVIQNNGNC